MIIISTYIFCQILKVKRVASSFAVLSGKCCHTKTKTWMQTEKIVQHNIYIVIVKRFFPFLKGNREPYQDSMLWFTKNIPQTCDWCKGRL